MLRSKVEDGNSQLLPFFWLGPRLLYLKSINSVLQECKGHRARVLKCMCLILNTLTVRYL